MKKAYICLQYRCRLYAINQTVMPARNNYTNVRPNKIKNMFPLLTTSLRTSVLTNVFKSQLPNAHNMYNMNLIETSQFIYSNTGDFVKLYGYTSSSVPGNLPATRVTIYVYVISI